jgi:predicted phosphoribosyltransferase
VRALRKRGAANITVAVPVGSDESVAMLEQEADRVVCLTIPRRLYGVGMWYRDFSPVSDEQVVALMAAAGPGAGRRENASGENAAGETTGS